MIHDSRLILQPINLVKMKKILVSFFLFAFVLTGFLAEAQFAQKPLSKKQAKKWFKKQQWLNGLQLKPHKSVNAQEFARQYQAHKAWWDTAFAFLRTQDLEKLPTGK